MSDAASGSKLPSTEKVLKCGPETLYYRKEDVINERDSMRKHEHRKVAGKDEGLKRSSFLARLLDTTTDQRPPLSGF